ncbi:hypothetical protein CC1G_12741 [Coprinopsis cinerea okayama7|uniref:Uncharacterized protein n=1 Tax=Coprinopsis cinerea (strain Okayama-7 / 130 / ATCC MYA-4618 / FGSC 9003) TaxID=240176 RepID=A8PHG1_COPC7|nr:hypothetical protein CC1G_12741 [Coprinopsis cinerea okayama7\|eukprot:XP_001841399.2 hypothetical protein CC1G_12741 [Coprinopsis cinerea okayama7\
MAPPFALPLLGTLHHLEAWETKADKAAGWIWLMLEDSQKIHVSSHRDDPCKMWTLLRDAHMQQKPGTCFNAYDDFSIRKREDKSLQALMNRVDDVVKLIKDLRPSDFTLDKLDNKLTAMAQLAVRRRTPQEAPARRKVQSHSHVPRTLQGCWATRGESG